MVLKIRITTNHLLVVESPVSLHRAWNKLVYNTSSNMSSIFCVSLNAPFYPWGTSRVFDGPGDLAVDAATAVDSFYILF